MRGFVHKNPEEIWAMIKKGHATKHDLEGRLVTNGLKISGWEYHGEFSIFSYSQIRSGDISFNRYHVRGTLDLEGLEVCSGQLILCDITVDGDLLLPKSLLEITLLSNLRVRGNLKWV